MEWGPLRIFFWSVKLSLKFTVRMFAFEVLSVRKANTVSSSQISTRLLSKSKTYAEYNRSLEIESQSLSRSTTSGGVLGWVVTQSSLSSDLFIVKVFDCFKSEYPVV